MDDSIVYEQSSSFSLAKVFGWMGLGLLLTFGVAYGFLYLIPALGISSDVYMGLMIGAIALMFIETFVLQYRVLRNHKSAVAPFVIYAISMGLLMSSIILYTDVKIILLSLGTTALVFGLLAVFGLTSKKNLSTMGSVASMVVIGGIVISLVNVFIGSSSVYWIVSLATFGAFMLFTAFDMWRVKKIIQSGEGTTNLAIFCAFQLYVDFIYIFMRIAEIFFMNSNN